MHVEKYTKDAVRHLLQHYSREAKNYSNKDIDKERTAHNYNLCERENDFEYYKQRLSEVKCQNRADVKTLCDWVITLPKDLFSDEEERCFFKAAYDFMKDRYGEDNIISAWVHCDEAGQHHMHFAFIPIVFDKKKGVYKVSAKEVINKKELQIIHKEIEAYISESLGRDVIMLNGATKAGNKTVEELKAYGDLAKTNETLKAENKELEQNIEQRRSEAQAWDKYQENKSKYLDAYRRTCPEPERRREAFSGKEYIRLETSKWDDFVNKYDELTEVSFYCAEQAQDREEVYTKYKEVLEANSELFDSCKKLEKENISLSSELHRLQSRINEVFRNLMMMFPQVRPYLEQFRTKKQERTESQLYEPER